MKYKLLILDLDGTAVASQRGSHPSKRVKNAVKAAHKHVKVTVATGRPIHLTQYILDELEITAPCVVDGGSQILDPKSGKKYFEKLVAAGQVRAIVEILSRFQSQFGDAKANITNGDSITLDQAIKTGLGITKIWVGNIKPVTSIKILEELEAVEGIAPHLSSSWYDGDVVDLHITHAMATKRHGIEKLLKTLGVKKSEAIGIGDHHNDLPLLESVGFKVVMGNAPKELKAIADHVVPDLEHDGVAFAIEKFITNQKT